MGRAGVTGQRATASTGIDRNIRTPTLEPSNGLPDLDAMPGAVCVYLRSADGSLQFTYFSAQAESLLGHTPDALIADPMTLVGCVHPDDRELLLHHLGHGPDEASDWKLDIRIGTAVEIQRWTRLRVRVTARGEEAEGHGILYEIDPHEIESRGGDNAAGRAGHGVSAWQTALTRQADEAKARFLAMMTHEIRTALNGVIGMTGMLRETKLAPVQQDYADMVLDSAKSLVALVNDVLDFSKLDGDNLELEAIDFDVVHLATNVFHVFELMADSGGIDFMLDIAPNIATRLQGDPGRLRQVLVNLVGNAVKFTVEGSVSLSLLGTTHDDRQMIRFEVIDTGIGIPEAAKARMFSEFSQADSSISRRFGGSGLGLTISQKLVRLMGGQIGFNSSEGVGSRFWFEIPVVEPDIPDRADTEDRSIEGVRVLLAGLSNVDCDLIRDGLEASGALVEVRKSGTAALTAFDEAASGGAATAYRFVIIDKEIDEPAVEVLASRLSEHPRGKGASLVLMASAGMRGDASQASASGFDAYLTKPLSARLVRECLAELAHRPDSETAASLVTAHSLREQSPTGLNVLFADDNNMQRGLVRRLLAARGHRVKAVEDGQAALDAVVDEEFDFALIGEHMPKLDGLATLRGIRALRTGQESLPVYVVTGTAGPGMHKAFLDAGADGVFEEPLENFQLIALIDKVRGALTSDGPVEVGDNDLDDTQLVAFEQVFGRDETLRVVTEFVAKADSSMASLRGHWDEGAIEQLARLAHELKVGAHSFGLARLAKASVQFEDAVVEGQLDEVPRRLAALEQVYPAAHAALDGYFDGLAG